MILKRILNILLTLLYKTPKIRIPVKPILARRRLKSIVKRTKDHPQITLKEEKQQLEQYENSFKNHHNANAILSYRL